MGDQRPAGSSGFMGKNAFDPLIDYAQGGEFVPETIPDDLAWNDQQAAGWQNKSLQMVLDNLHDTRRAILEELDKLSAAQWELQLPAPWGGHGTLASLISGLSWHEHEHLDSIRKFLKGKAVHSAPGE